MSSNLADEQLVIASASDVLQIAIGQIIYVSHPQLHDKDGARADIQSFGYTGLQMLQQIVIADMTNLQWRYVFTVLSRYISCLTGISGLVTGLISAPFIINNFVAAEIAQAVLPNWYVPTPLAFCVVLINVGAGGMPWYARIPDVSRGLS